MSGITEFDQYFGQFQSVLTLESLPAVCVVGLNPEPGTDQFRYKLNARVYGQTDL